MLGILYCFQVAGDVVIVAFPFNQTGRCFGAVHIVVQVAVFFDQAILDDHLSVRVEGIIASRLQIVGLGNIVSAILDSLEIAGNVVVAAIHFNQAGIVLHIVDIVAEVAIQIFMEPFQLHQPTFGIKGILGCLQQTVGLGYISFNTCDHTIALEVTIIVAVLH